MADSQFTIEEKLSESGSTSVYRAFDEVLHRRVLLKVLHKHLANDTDLRQRFIREARAIAALKSEYIVQIYDLTERDGAPAIVMEFVEGKSLKDVIADGTNRSAAFAKKVALHILRGLSVAHRHGVIHRDIKPGNIIVSHDGSVKVTDFGLAYVALSPTMTIEGTVLGTPAYMAPEQIRGDDVDARTDLFSLGATLVEVLTGERIFEGSTYSECLKKVLAFKAVDIEHLSVNSSPEFTAFLQKLMHPKKEERFNTAQDALNALDEKKSSIFILPDIRTTTKHRKHHPVAAGIVLVVLIGIISWVSFRQSDGSEIFPTMSNAKDSGQTGSQVIAAQGDPPREHMSTQSEGDPPPVPPGKKETVKSTLQAIDSGKVYFICIPWAKVYIDDKPVGETPIAPMLLTAGHHIVTFDNPSFDPIVRSVTVEAHRDITVTGDFMQNVGYVMCNVHPWADVYVDEQKKGTTPMKPIMLSSGMHTLRFKNISYEDIVKEITVTAKDTLPMTVTFNK
jgi:eukaryotic-like serine/threonine-protein kinase